MAEQGWGQPMRAGKPHYFVEGTSLCGCWDCYGGPLEKGRCRPGLDCAHCIRAFNRAQYQTEMAVITTPTAVTYTQRSEVRH